MSEKVTTVENTFQKIWKDMTRPYDLNKDWYRSSPRVRLLRTGYLLTVSAILGYRSFQDGRDALNAHRQGYAYQYCSEREAVRAGCYSNLLENAAEVAFFPITYPVRGISEIIPSLVMKMNPPKE